MVTKFSGKFAIIMLKKHRKFWLTWMPHPLSKIVQIHMTHPVDKVRSYTLNCPKFYSPDRRSSNTLGSKAVKRLLGLLYITISTNNQAFINTFHCISNHWVLFLFSWKVHWFLLLKVPSRVATVAPENKLSFK